MYKFIIPTLAVFVTNPATAADVKDIHKNVVMRQPYQIEVCSNEATGGDKTADTLKGALIGGAIGNNVTKDLDNGAAVGALLGGWLAHKASQALASAETVCKVETRYNETVIEKYTHSIVTFMHDGREYNLQFVK